MIWCSIEENFTWLFRFFRMMIIQYYICECLMFVLYFSCPTDRQIILSTGLLWYFYPFGVQERTCSSHLLTRCLLMSPKLHTLLMVLTMWRLLVLLPDSVWMRRGLLDVYNLILFLCVCLGAFNKLSPSNGVKMDTKIYAPKPSVRLLVWIALHVPSAVYTWYQFREA